MAKAPQLINHLTAAYKGGRAVYGMVKRNEAPVIVEAQTLKDLEAETYGFRNANGIDNHDLTPWSQEKQQKKGVSLFQRDSMARRTIMLVRDFVTADGITVQAQHDDPNTQQEIQTEIDRFWNDPVNSMDRLNPDRVQDFQIYGELCMPVKVNEWDGRTRIGWIDPCVIQEVIPDPVTGRPGVIVMPDSLVAKVGQKHLQVVRYDEAEGRLVGDVFFYAKGNVMNSLRGLGNLYSSADEFDQMRELYRVEMDRAKMMLRFIWDVTLTGMNETEIEAWYKKNGAVGKPNSVKAHNEHVTWKAESPDLRSSDVAGLVKTLKERLMGGQGIPNHWFGAGDDANLATASAMGAPTKKGLKARGNEYKWTLQDVLWHHLQSRQAVDKQFLRGVDLAWEAPFAVHIPELADRDLGALGEAMSKVSSALTVAVDRGWVSEDTAAAMFAMMSTETGMEIDAADERQKIEADRVIKEKAEAKRGADQEEQMRQAMLEHTRGEVAI